MTLKSTRSQRAALALLAASATYIAFAAHHHGRTGEYPGAAGAGSEALFGFWSVWSWAP